MENRIKFKIGEIEFEVSGEKDIIERERQIFLNTILPAAVDALKRTSENNNLQIENGKSISLIDTIEEGGVLSDNKTDDFTRMNLPGFIKEYGRIKDSDFVLLSTYFEEKKNSNKVFTTSTIKRFYNEARRKEYSNISKLISELVKKGYIMDSPESENKSPKEYILTDSGIRFASNYQIEKNENQITPKKTRNRKKTKKISQYEKYNADDLHLEKYPTIKEINKFKDQLALVMYIFQQENLGVTFAYHDIIHIFTNILGIPITDNQVSGVFHVEKTWFKTNAKSENDRYTTRSLLDGGKMHVEEEILVKS